MLTFPDFILTLCNTQLVSPVESYRLPTEVSPQIMSYNVVVLKVFEVSEGKRKGGGQVGNYLKGGKNIPLAMVKIGQYSN